MQNGDKSLFNTSKHTTTLLKVHELLRPKSRFLVALKWLFSFFVWNDNYEDLEDDACKL